MARKAPKVSEALRQAIADSGKPMTSIERATGVHNSALSRFMRGERTLTLTTVDILARHLELELVTRSSERR
ncbi:MAG: helix-turn-helix transcriptional regulator [Phycisphaerae bacterium]